jgi:hypothetical protein
MMKGRSLIFVMFVVVLSIVVLSSSAWAMEPPIGGESIQGPALWGVVVIDCTNNLASLRVKQVCDCNVKTQAWTMAWTADCPDDAGDPLYFRLDFSIEGCDSNPIPGTPIITKVKNFKVESLTGVVSFDAQIKFVVGTP